MTECERSRERWRRIRTVTVALLSLVGAASLCPAQGPSRSATFVVVGSDFHIKDRDDAGEVRICLQNTGRTPLSLAQFAVRIAAQRSDGPDKAGSEQQYLYARLSPPVLQPGQYGQLVAKLLNRPAEGHTLTCVISAGEGTTSCTVPAPEPILWLSYIGFSQDLRKVFVYVENPSDEVVHIESLRAGAAQVEDSAGAINRLVPPRDKGCLIGRFSTAIMAGEFTHVTVLAGKGEQEVQIHSVIRAINRIPLMRVESGTPPPDLELDLEGFTETIACIAHAHGTHEQAAGKFLADYVQRFRQNPRQVLQADICRSDSPRTWFRFGSLPDVARMNPVLLPPPGYDREDHTQWFHPFFYRGHLAKKAVEPCRYLAVIPTVPEEGLFLRKELTPQEVRFLVYSAVASGAKGLGYRGPLTDDPLSRAAFMRLNRELRQLEPLLLIGEPVDWAATTDSRYAVKSLWCGDQAILVMVFDCRYFSQQQGNKFYTPSFGKAVAHVRIDMKIPDEVSAEQVRSLSAPLERGTWVCREGHLSFTADMVESVHLYLVDLQSRTQPPGKGELSQ